MYISDEAHKQDRASHHPTYMSSVRRAASRALGWAFTRPCRPLTNRQATKTTSSSQPGCLDVRPVT